MKLSMVVAVGNKNVIGKDGQMPWNMPTDLKRFRTLTTGNIVVMGRKTYESIMERNGKPLPNRVNIVFSRTLDEIPGCIVCRNLKELLEIARREQKEVFIIGGEQIYSAFLPLVSRLYVTQICGDFEGDAFFPAINKDEWNYSSAGRSLVGKNLAGEQADPYGYDFMVFDRKMPTIIDATYAKDGDYGEVLKEIGKLGICPFCPDQLLWHPNPILKYEGNWLVTENGWPYKNSTTHLLFICRDHKTSILEMTQDDWKDIGVLMKYAVEKYGIKGGAFCARFGETLYTGATVVHLHFHMVVPTTEFDETGKRKFVSFPIG